MTDSSSATVTAALLVIGDEILSGRTKDKNIGYIAEYLTTIGIDLREVRVVPDVAEEIVGAVKALRAKADYLFTTGGIGPTHDDITADCVAEAVGVGISHDERAVAMLRERFPNPADLNEARLRMARIPHGADLIDNPISRAPGFSSKVASDASGIFSPLRFHMGRLRSWSTVSFSFSSSATRISRSPSAVRKRCRRCPNSS